MYVYLVWQVHMTFEGPAVLDISQHFVERWNEIKKRKVFDVRMLLFLDLTSFFPLCQYRDKEYAPTLFDIYH